jgi:hypothetical protein
MSRQILIRRRRQRPLLAVPLNSPGVPDRTFLPAALLLRPVLLMATTQLLDERLSRWLALFLFFF